MSRSNHAFSLRHSRNSRRFVHGWAQKVRPAQAPGGCCDATNGLARPELSARNSNMPHRVVRLRPGSGRKSPGCRAPAHSHGVLLTGRQQPQLFAPIVDHHRACGAQHVHAEHDGRLVCHPPHAEYLEVAEHDLQVADLGATDADRGCGDEVAEYLLRGGGIDLPARRRIEGRRCRPDAASSAGLPSERSAPVSMMATTRIPPTRALTTARPPKRRRARTTSQCRSTPGQEVRRIETRALAKSTYRHPRAKASAPKIPSASANTRGSTTGSSS